ncbi:MAG: hypothetical protein Sapg2KO_51450 [Saprospiraceae bacterium]
MKEQTTKTPTDFKKMLAQDRLEQLIEQLTAQTEAIGNGDLYNRVLIQAGKHKRNKQQNIKGTVDYDDITRTHNNIRVALLDIINDLPKTAETSTKDKKPWGVSEQGLKREIFWFLAVGKLFVIWFAFFLYSTGTGFTYQGFLLVLGIIVPTLAAYLGLIYEDLLNNRHEQNYKDFRISNSVRSSARFFFGLYFLMLFSALYLHGVGVIPDSGIINDDGKPNYENLTALLTLIESFVGGYIAILITKLFKS